MKEYSPTDKNWIIRNRVVLDKKIGDLVIAGANILPSEGFIPGARSIIEETAQLGRLKKDNRLAIARLASEMGYPELHHIQMIVSQVVGLVKDGFLPESILDSPAFLPFILGGEAKKRAQAKNLEHVRDTEIQLPSGRFVEGTEKMAQYCDVIFSWIPKGGITYDQLTLEIEGVINPETKKRVKAYVQAVRRFLRDFDYKIPESDPGKRFRGVKTKLLPVSAAQQQKDAIQRLRTYVNKVTGVTMDEESLPDPLDERELYIIALLLEQKLIAAPDGVRLTDKGSEIGEHLDIHDQIQKVIASTIVSYQEQNKELLPSDFTPTNEEVAAAMDHLNEIMVSRRFVDTIRSHDTPQKYLMYWLANMNRMKVRGKLTAFLTQDVERVKARNGLSYATWTIPE